VTVDGQRSAQFEHTVLVTSDGAEILTAEPEPEHVTRSRAEAREVAPS
jgi:hypothetical protein